MSESDYDSVKKDQPITKQDYDELITQAEQVLVSLSDRLSNVSVQVGKGSTDVLVAIKMIFGNKYIKPDGSSEITFDMFQQLTTALKKMGVDKVQEYL